MAWFSKSEIDLSQTKFEKFTVFGLFVATQPMWWCRGRGQDYVTPLSQSEAVSNMETKKKIPIRKRPK